MNKDSQNCVQELDCPATARVLSMGGACNNNCRTCVKTGRAPTVRTSGVILAEARAAVRVCHGFILSRGEPTLVQGLPDLLSQLKQLSPDVLQVHTNARMLASGTYARSLLTVPGVDYVVRVFSIEPHIHDALTCDPGSWEQTFKGLKNLSLNRAPGIGVHVEIPLTAENADGVPDLIRALNHLRPDSIIVSGGYPAAQGMWLEPEAARAAALKAARTASSIPVSIQYADGMGFAAEPRMHWRNPASGNAFTGVDTNNPLCFSASAGSGKCLMAYVPYSTETAAPFLAAPLSLGAMRAFLGTLGYECDLVDLEARCMERGVSFVQELKGCWFVEQDRGRSAYEEIQPWLQTLLPSDELSGYDAIGLSLVEHFQALFAVHVARYIKTHRPDAALAVGCLRPDEKSGYQGCADVLFELAMFGEYCMAGLMNRLEYGDRADGAIYGNSAGFAPESKYSLPHAADLKRLPGPDFGTLDPTLYKRSLSPDLAAFLEHTGRPTPRDPVGLAMFDISKGCGFKCVYCSYRERFLLKDPDRAAADMAAIADQTGLTGFHMLDTSINNDLRHLEKFCDALITRRIRVLWSCSARPCFRDTALPLKMREAGCVMLTHGLESGSPRILHAMNKAFTPGMAETGLANLAAAGIINQINLLSGFPHETDQDVAETIAFITRNRAHIDLISSHASFMWYANLDMSPERAGVTLHNRILDTPSGHAFPYDETGGRAWDEIRDAKERAYLQIEDAIAVYRRINRRLCEADIFNIYSLGLGRAGCLEYFDYLKAQSPERPGDEADMDNRKFNYRIRAFLND